MAGIPKFPTEFAQATGAVTLEAFNVVIQCNKDLMAEMKEADAENDALRAKVAELSRQLIEERARVTELTLKIADYIRIWDAQITRRAP